MRKEIHWWDFPDDIYILLKEDYRKSLFQESNYRIAKRLNVSISTVWEWKNAKKGESLRYTPVFMLKKIHKLYNIPFSKTEKYIVSYSAYHGGHIDNPKLPIKESPEIFQIIGHLFGDGSANKVRAPSYCNTSTSVRKEFISLICSTFGKVNLKEYPKHSLINMPRAISKIIMHNYKIESFDTFVSRIPDNIKKKDPNLIKGIIKAFIIDEGSIRDAGVDIYSANFNLLEDLQYICLKLKYKYGSIKKSSGCFYFKIFSKSIPKLIYDLSPLSHESKNKKLSFILERQNRGWRCNKNGVTKEKILEFLFIKPMTVFELSKELLIAPKTINGYHLKRLEQEGLIKRDDSGKEHIWSLN